MTDKKENSVLGQLNSSKMRLILILALSHVVRGEFPPATDALIDVDIKKVGTQVCQATLPTSPGSDPVTSSDASNRYSNEPVTTTDCCSSPPIQCPELLYRTQNEECNNLIYTQWGTSANYMTRLQFTTEKDYEQFDKTSDGRNTTSARVKSTTALGNEEIPSDHLSHWTMTFGQGIAHDCVDSTAKSSVQSCCNGPEAVQNASCAAIAIPKDDSYYSQYNKTCQDVVRRETNEDNNCHIIKPHQMNLVTSPIDASIVYGNNEESARDLRLMDRGLLKYSVIDGQNYTITQSEGCDPRAKLCFKAGDARVNQNTGITVFQNIFLRLHNIICEELAVKNPHWNDERLYQEGRKLIIALLQKIVYYNYLPHVLGKEEANKFTSDDPALMQEWRTYNAFTHVGSFIEWNLCYRQFHTLVRDEFAICDKDGNLQEEGGFKLADYFNRPDPVPQYFDQLICGLAKQHAKEPDMNVVDSIHHNLFKETHETGEDLISVDIVRDAEWIADGYTAIIENIWGKKIQTFEDLKEYIDQQIIEKILKKLYEKPEDIDLYIGTLAEKKAEGSVLGETCNKIVTEQFRRWLVGDRFYFEFGWFTKDQLDQIYKATWSTILCKTSSIPTITKDAFIVPSEQNPEIDCSKMEFIDFEPWKEP